MLEAQIHTHNSEDKWKNQIDRKGKGEWKYCMWVTQKSLWSGAGINIKRVENFFRKQSIRQGTFYKTGVIFFTFAIFMPLDFLIHNRNMIYLCKYIY